MRYTTRFLTTILLVVALIGGGSAGCANEQETIPGDGSPVDSDDCQCPEDTIPGTLCDCLIVEDETGGFDPCLNQCGTGTVCDKQTATCVPEPIPTPTCNDGNPCTDDVVTNGKCVITAKTDGATCDDLNKCTTGDKCSNAQCGGSTLTCDDGNGCTADTCVTATGCSYLPVSGVVCDDGNACTTGDKCSAGACVGTPMSCNDNNVCTSDSCVAGACVYDPLSGGSCDDGNAGTSGDMCMAGVCKGSTMSCDDADACTTDMMTAGVCSNPAVNCNDGKVCTTDTCVPSSGCSYASNAVGCDDGNPCTTGDACSGGACAPGTASKNCDDGDACTTDSCDPLVAAGCAHMAIAGCPKSGEVCGNGIDEDGDGLIDCQDKADCGGNAVGYIARFYSASGGTIWIQYGGLPSPIQFSLQADEKGPDGVLGNADDVKTPTKVTWNCSEVPTSVFVDSNGAGQISAYVNDASGKGPPPAYWKFDVWIPSPAGPLTVPPVGAPNVVDQASASLPGGGDFVIYWSPQ